MRKRWRIILPIVALTVFGCVSYNSLRTNDAFNRAPSRYVWWSNLRLDSDPSHKLNWNSEWEPTERWGFSLPTFLLTLSALPAFLVGWVLIVGLGRFGFSQVSSFMSVTPVLILIWYYFLGW